ncbi:MAG: DNA repair protein RecO [Nitrospirae bacterium]|nr:MAG: DNA repair protein RecO [Nitrospirota bacterium]
MPLLNSKAVILHSQRWGEADRIITGFSQRAGKIRAIAYGARKLKSRFGGVLEPFNLIQLTLFERTPTSLARVSQAELLESFSAIREHLHLMGQAARMATLVKAITADHDPNEALFQALVGGLRALTTTPDPQGVMLVFQIHVLDHAGFRPEMGSCTTCGSSLGTARGWFAPWSGGMICAQCRHTQSGPCLSMAPGSIAFVNQAKRLPFPVVTRLRATGQVRREVEEALDAFIRTILGTPLPEIASWAAEDEPRYALPVSSARS